MDRCSNIDTLYENDDFLIVDKPYDLLINSDDEGNMNTLHRILVAKNGLVPEIDCQRIASPKHGYHFIHRLDYATSGVICLSKNPRAAALAGRLFEKRLVDKYYLAIVSGHLADELMQVDVAIGYDLRHINDNKMMCEEGPNCSKPKQASTRILLLETGLYGGREASKVLMKPLTGRRHQLRLHCRLIDHTIIGDYTYSDRTDTDPHRMFLHAHRLRIPLRDEPIDVSSADPFTRASDESWTIKEVHNCLSGDGGNSAYDKLDRPDGISVIKYINKRCL